MIAAGAIVVWYIHDTLLLVFAGLLLALVIRSASEPLARIMRLRAVLTVWLTVAAILLVSVLAVALLGNAVALQLGELKATLPAALQDAVSQMRATALGLWIANYLAGIPPVIPDTTNVLMRATGMLSGALGAVAGALITVFVGIAIALEPELYSNGLVQLFPANYRAHVRDVLVEMHRTLRTWIIARLLTMAVTGTLATIGLTILHVPLAVALGVLAGALAFIPNVGAFIAAAPAVILAFVAGPRAALMVTAMYVLVHILDDFIVGPFVERQVVKLPPVLTLVVQIVLGIAAGAIGIMLAAPLAAVGLVAVRRFWVHDVADHATD